MTNQNRPVYRYPPKSHAYSCRCPRCAPFYSRKSAGSDLIGFDLGCLGVLLGFAGISALIGFLSRLPAQAWLTAGAVTGILVITGAVFRVVTRPVRPPKGRLKVEAGPQPYSQPPLICAHERTDPVYSIDVPGSPAVEVARICLNPDCGAQLPAGWTLPASAPLPPPPAEVPAGPWSWNWHCSCGTALSGHARTATAAKAACAGIPPHAGRGHWYQYTWQRS